MIYRNHLGELHREDGPAIETENSKSFFINDKRHNLNGPAIISGDHEEYWIDGKPYKKEEWIKLTRKIKLKKLLS